MTSTVSHRQLFRDRVPLFPERMFMVPKDQRKGAKSGLFSQSANTSSVHVADQMLAATENRGYCPENAACEHCERPMAACGSH